MKTLTARQTERLHALGDLLVDQEQATAIVEPTKRADGFWFGGGNVIDTGDGVLWLVGRYRDAGDSRLGTDAGTRGRELTLLRSDNRGASFEPVTRWAKSDLRGASAAVISIEGSALWLRNGRVELYISTERDREYPPAVGDYRKPGTGVWEIHRLVADAPEGLGAASLEAVSTIDDPDHLHVKDPFVVDGQGLGLCTHPFTWASTNTGLLPLTPEGLGPPVLNILPRGNSWDVAITRATAVVPVPRVGDFADTDTSLVFYDGGESLRNLDEHAAAAARPRGYSCEELGGFGVADARALSRFTRLSTLQPSFRSPWGTACSRYVDVLATDDYWFVTWQQSQDDRSQPLVMNRVDAAAVLAVLA